MSNRVGKNQIECARSVDLNRFMLDVYPEQTQPDGKNHSRWTENRKVVFSDHGFYDNSTGRADNAISFLVEYLDMPFQDAVRALCDYDDGRDPELCSHASVSVAVSKSTEQNVPVPSDAGSFFVAPTRALCPVELRTYLCDKRGIDAALLDPEIVYPTISNRHVNAVFLSRDCNYAEIRGTEPCYPFKGKAAHCDHDGYWIVGSRTPREICICEAAIDALSLLNIYQLNGYDCEKYSLAFVSIGGCGCTKAIKRVQRQYPFAVLHLCFDNDDAGRHFAESLPQYPSHFPENQKDWNDVLVAHRKNQQNNMNTLKGGLL